MFAGINEAFNEAKSRAEDDAFILEAVIEDILPGSDEEDDDIVDSESIPKEIYDKVDKALDAIIDDPNYDDTEIEELLDDEDLDDGDDADEDED